MTIKQSHFYTNADNTKQKKALCLHIRLKEELQIDPDRETNLRGVLQLLDPVRSINLNNDTY